MVDNTFDATNDTVFTQHPLSAAFPAMQAEDYQALVDSITMVGVLNPITIYEGMVIDGWHRYNAANDAGMPCPIVELDDTDPRDFVLAQNKARRHVSAGQLALAVAAVYKWRPHGDQRSALNADRASAVDAGAAKTTVELADIAGVGTRTMEQAKAVVAEAEPEVKEAVRSGEIGLPKAAAIAKLPPEDQAAAITKPAPKPKASKAKSEVPPPADDALRAEVAELRNKLAELASSLEETIAENDLMARVFDADDKVAAAMAEAKKFREMNRVLEERVRGLMNEKNEAIRAAKSWQRKAEGK